MYEIKNERDYAIRKGKVLENFTEEFFVRHRDNPLYRNVYESLIRDADPYEIIEKLIAINADQYAKLHKVIVLMNPQQATQFQQFVNELPPVL